MATNTFFSTTKSINIKGALWHFDAPKVMGILNIGTHSFYDGGKFVAIHDALLHIENMMAAGADLIDIGATSTKPGQPLSLPENEWQLLEPLLLEIQKTFPQLIFSVDTYHHSIAQKAADYGAALINDISGGTFDPHMLATVAKLRMPYILMHTPATPQHMQNETHYAHVVAEIMTFFSSKLAILRSHGINDIILDPGFGFGKTVDQNFEILRQLTNFKIFGLPIMAGLSRKSMINKTLQTHAEDALNGTTVLNTLALQNGAHLLRVHDVKEAVQAVKLFTAFAKTNPPNL